MELLHKLLLIFHSLAQFGTKKTLFSPFRSVFIQIVNFRFKDPGTRSMWLSSGESVQNNSDWLLE